MNQVTAMKRQLLKLSLATPSICRASQKTSQHCKLLPRLYRGGNVTRSYITPPPVKKRRDVGSPVTWAGLAIFLVTGGALYTYVVHVKEEKEKTRKKEETRSVGTAAIGGPFDLVDTEGNEVTQDTFLGKWILIYFGFCNCPDICPDQMDKFSDVVESVKAKEGLPNVQPVFITVDPLRDTREIIREYLEDFHPDYIGLTGTEEQVKRVCKAYRVYFSQGPEDEDEDYIVDHTVIAYLVDPAGKFSTFFGQNKSAEQIVNDILIKMSFNN